MVPITGQTDATVSGYVADVAAMSWDTLCYTEIFTGQVVREGPLCKGCLVLLTGEAQRCLEYFIYSDLVTTHSFFHNPVSRIGAGETYEWQTIQLVIIVKSKDVE